MTDRTTQDRFHPSDLPDVILAHVETITALIATLCELDAPYVVTVEENGSCVDRFTDQGYRLAESAHTIALDAARHLWDTAGRMIPSEPGYEILNDLHYDAAKLLAVVSAALGGISKQPEPSAVVGGGRILLSEMKKRCQSLEVSVAAQQSEAGLEDPVSTMVDTPPPAETVATVAPTSDIADDFATEFRALYGMLTPLDLDEDFPDCHIFPMRADDAGGKGFGMESLMYLTCTVVPQAKRVANMVGEVYGAGVSPDEVELIRALDAATVASAALFAIGDSEMANADEEGTVRATYRTVEGAYHGLVTAKGGEVSHA